MSCKPQTRLRLETLEDRLAPAWAGVAPLNIDPAATVPSGVLLNAHGDATARAAITRGEVDWYTFVAPSSRGTYTLSATRLNGRLNTVLGVYNAAGARVATNDNLAPTNLNSRVVVRLLAGHRYHVGVTNRTGSSGGAYQWRFDGQFGEDVYEAPGAVHNNTLSRATNLGILTRSVSLVNLVMADGGDWYRFTTSFRGRESDVARLNFQHVLGNLELGLYTPAGTLVRASQSTGDGEVVSLENLVPGTYYLRVWGAGGARNPHYSLSITPPSMDDIYEDNDTRATATDLGRIVGNPVYTGLRLDDHDWYRFSLDAPRPFETSVFAEYDSWQGALRMDLYDSAGTRLMETVFNDPAPYFDLDALPGGTYYLEVWGYGSTGPLPYTLHFSSGVVLPPLPEIPDVPRGNYDITLFFPDVVPPNDRTVQPLTTYQQAILQRAARRWEQVIIEDLPDIGGFANQIHLQSVAIDDMLIDVYVGDPNTWSTYGPDAVSHGVSFGWMRSLITQGTDLPFYSAIELNPHRLDALTRTGQLYWVMLHEIGHSLGFHEGFLGALYQDAQGNNVYPHFLITGVQSGDYRWVGPRAVAEYRSMFGLPPSIVGVPLENAFGPGQDLVHWRVGSLMGNDLMATARGARTSLSRITAAFMADLGYVVNMLAADAYTPPPGALP